MSAGAAGDKTTWRRALLARRRAVPAADRAAEATTLAAALPMVLAELLDGGTGPLCLHVPVGSEPGAVAHGVPPLLDAALAAGHRVLLPVTVGAAPLDWVEYGPGAPLVPADRGLLEPSGPRLGPDAVADAALVLVPALAVDRAGVRLGRGGGHYDRTLPRAGARTRLVALVRDDELLDALPAEEHDVRVHAAWCPGTGLVGLG